MQSDISMTFALAAGGGRIQSTVNAACIEDELLSSDGKNIKATNPKVCRFFVPLTELFSNNFMEDLEKIWELRAFIPDPTTPPLLYRSTDTEDMD